MEMVPRSAFEKVPPPTRGRAGTQAHGRDVDPQEHRDNRQPDQRHRRQVELSHLCINDEVEEVGHRSTERDALERPARRNAIPHRGYYPGALPPSRRRHLPYGSEDPLRPLTGGPDVRSQCDSSFSWSADAAVGAPRLQLLDRSALSLSSCASASSSLMSAGQP